MNSILLERITWAVFGSVKCFISRLLIRIRHHGNNFSFTGMTIFQLQLVDVKIQQ